MFNRKVSSLVSFVVLLPLLLLLSIHSLSSSVVVARDVSPTRHRLIGVIGSKSDPVVNNAASDAVGKRSPSP